MTRRDEVIRMARKASNGEPIIGKLSNEMIAKAWAPFFERFAAMVAVAERERCAKEVEAIRDDYVATEANRQACAADYIAERIRALKDGE